MYSSDIILKEIGNKTIKIKTPEGFKPIEWIARLPPEICCKLILRNGLVLSCSLYHQVYDVEKQQFIFAEDSLNKTILCDEGSFSRVKEIQLYTEPSVVYDLQVEGHVYYANGILSHNSTMSAIFLLHYILFNADKTVAILANKASTAKTVLQRIKTSYENLPIFLQQGIVEWNKNSIELENGSRVLASSSSASNIRGESINILYLDECLSGETKVIVRNKNTQEIQQIPLNTLFTSL